MKYSGKPKKSNITFIIFTFNEEKRIEYPIKCFLPYGEVIVSDNSSTDGTVKIAKRLGAKVIKRKSFLVVENKEETDFIFSHVKTDWVFWGFADDMIPRKCLDLYEKISQENKYKIIVQKRKTLAYDGKSEFHSGFFSVKFFRKDSLDFSNNTIHQMGKFLPHVKPSEVYYLPPIDEYSAYHFSLDTTETLISRINLYTTIQIKFIQEKVSLIRLISVPFCTFVAIYFSNGLWKYGIKGYIFSMNFFVSSFIALAKKYENDNGISLDSIEKKFVEEKKFLISKNPKSNVFKKLCGYFLSHILLIIYKRYKFSQIK